MRERFPVSQADRVVGRDEVSLEELAERFGEPPVGSDGQIISEPGEVLKRIYAEHAPECYEQEIDKSERDKEILSIATDAVRAYAAEYGRERFIELPLEHIHLLKPGGTAEMTEGRLEIGSHATVPGSIVIDRRSDLETAITAFHELWHTLASHNAIQVTKDGRLTWYRSGFGMSSRNGENEYFHHLDEALTGLATARFVNERLRAEEGFKDEIREREDRGEAIDTTRKPEIAEFMRVVDDLAERNQESLDREKVLDLFFRAQVTGNVLPVARLVEATYGKGSFRKLGRF